MAEGQQRRRRLFTEPVILHIGGRQTIGYAFYELEGGLGITIAKGKFSIAAGDAIGVRVGGEVRTAVIGRFKTGHFGAIQNQPGVSVMIFVNLPKCRKGPWFRPRIPRLR